MCRDVGAVTDFCLRTGARLAVGAEEVASVTQARDDAAGVVTDVLAPALVLSAHQRSRLGGRRHGRAAAAVDEVEPVEVVEFVVVFVVAVAVAVVEMWLAVVVDEVDRDFLRLGVVVVGACRQREREKDGGRGATVDAYVISPANIRHGKEREGKTSMSAMVNLSQTLSILGNIFNFNGHYNGPSSLQFH